MSSIEAPAVAIEVPDIGGFEDVSVIEILVSPGDQIQAEDPVLTLESDKATMDVPAPFSGYVQSISVAVGDRVSQGSALLTIVPSQAAPGYSRATAIASDGAPSEAAAPDAIASAQEAEEGSASQASAPSRNGEGEVYASPSVRRVARVLGVDLAQMSGTGRKGRIVREDVEAAAGAGESPAGGTGVGRAGAIAAVGGLELAPWPSVKFEKFGPVERVSRSRIQKISAANLARNWVMIPHVTHNDQADITGLEAWRKELNEEHSRDGVKVTMVSFLILASVATLKEFPIFNASLDGEELVLKRYWNIGFAADTPGGLVVPVIRDADRKGLLEVAQELTALSSRARDGKLTPAEMSGSTFTVSSLGGMGGTSFTPIINAPEVAILGATRSSITPVWNGEEFAPRLMLPLSLSYDHRVIDGAAAARFVVHLVRVLADLRRVLL
ncbi:MAG: dihydrolipoyllysine-residue acetyltransferase [Solirubrobacteraceae bacterium]